MPQDTPSRKLDQYIVRFPDGMRDRLKDEAEKNGRSMNAEIVQRLGMALDTPPNQIRITLPDDLASTLAVFATAHDQSIDEFVVRALRTEMLYESRSEPPVGSASELQVELGKTVLDLEQAQEKLKQLVRERDRAQLDAEKLAALSDTLDQYKTLAARQDALLKAVCYRILQFKSVVPEDAFQLAENLLNADGSEDGAFSIENDKYAPQVALARYHAAVAKLRYSPADASQTTDNRRTSSRRHESNAAKLKKGSAA